MAGRCTGGERKMIPSQAVRTSLFLTLALLALGLSGCAGVYATGGGYGGDGYGYGGDYYDTGVDYGGWGGWGGGYRVGPYRNGGHFGGGGHGVPGIPMGRGGGFHGGGGGAHGGGGRGR